jgi:hypothetical protein
MVNARELDDRSMTVLWPLLEELHIIMLHLVGRCRRLANDK